MKTLNRVVELIAVLMLLIFGFQEEVSLLQSIPIFLVSSWLLFKDLQEF